MTKSTSNIPKHVIYDVTFKCHFNCIMSGSSASGKTTILLEFLQLKGVICNAKFYKIDHQLLIIDDLLCNIVSRKDDLMQKLFTVYSNQKIKCYYVRSNAI